MTRAELIDGIAMRRRDLSSKVIEHVIKRIIEKMISSLEKGHRIEIRGFGSFSLRKRQPRQARNPKTGDLVLTDMKHVIYFKPGKSLRDRINEGIQKEDAFA